MKRATFVVLPIVMFFAWWLSRPEPPIAVGDTVRVAEEGRVQFNALENDSDPQGRELRLVSVQGARGASIEFEPAGDVRYSPPRDFFGEDRLEYRVAAGGQVVDGYVTVEVSNVNDAPEAVNDHFALDESGRYEFDVLANDRDADGDDLTIVDVRVSRGEGQASFDGAEVTYAPAPLEMGPLKLTYCVADESGETSEARVDLRIVPFAPSFFAGDGPAAMVEILSAPPSSPYGSDIDFWVYQDGTGTRRVVVTGHGDQVTCEAASGLVYVGMVMSGSVEDVFVAGAASLDGGAPAPADRKELLRLTTEHARAEVVRDAVKGRASPGSGPESALAVAELRVEEASANLASAKRDQAAATRLALSLMLAEARNLSARSGLVRVHELDYSLVASVETRLRSAALGDGQQVLRLDDLVDAAREAVVVVPMLNLGTAEDVRIEIPLEVMKPELMGQAYKEARAGVTKSLIGDARRRKIFALKQLKDAEASLERQKRLPRGEIVKLSIIVTPDGEFPSDDPIFMSRGEYVDFKLPKNIRGYRAWAENAADLLELVQGEAKEMFVDESAYSTLFDAMLRGWDLPIAKSQEAFETWCEEVRRDCWIRLYEELQKRGIRRDALSGDSVVFDVQVEHDAVTIRPLHVLDLNRSVVLFDRKVAATRSLSTWQRRTLSPAEGEAPRRRRALDAFVNGSPGVAIAFTAETREAIRSEIRDDPERTLEELMGLRDEVLPTSALSRGDVSSELEATLRIIERREAFFQVMNDPVLKEPNNVAAYLDALWELLQAYPEVDVTYHLAVARDYARLLSEVVSVDVWQILRDFDGPFDPDLHRAARLLIRERTEFEDPGRRIHACLLSARAVDSEYVDDVLAAEGFPEATEEKQTEDNSLLEGLELIELELLQLVRARMLMSNRARVMRAAHEVWLRERPDLEHVRNDLDQVLGSPLGNPPALRAARAQVDSALRRQPNSRRRRRWRDRQHDSMITELNRLEIASSIENAGRLLMQRALSISPPEESYVRFLADHLLLDARIEFERGSYVAGLDAMLPSQVPTALWHPDLVWDELDGGTHVGVIRMGCELEDRGLLVWAEIAGKADGEPTQREILLLHGVAREELAKLVKPIEQCESWAEDAKLSDQVMLLRFPLHWRAQRVRDVLADEAIRRDLIKVMVYGRMPPGGEEFPLSGRWIEGEESRERWDGAELEPGTSLHVPTLDDLFASELKRLREER